jgi:predicted DNA-binding transcriptional regulator YafY
MAKNKDFFHRVAIIDECLRRRDKKWYIDELLDCVNERLHLDYNKSISVRTLQYDIDYLIKEKQAPIDKIRDGNKVLIRYSDINFSIKNIPLQDEELILLKDAANILRQVSGLSIIHDIDGIVTKLENTIAVTQQNNQSLIQFEKHTSSTGSAYMDDIFTAIKANIALEIEYQPFGKNEPYKWLVHPYLLKEYRNRWFLIGRLDGEKKLTTIALDRIKKIKPSQKPYIQNDLFDTESFFNNVIGVTLPEGEDVCDIIINVKAKQAPYIRTKPIHFRQDITRTNEDGSIQIKLRLINNYELRSVLLSYGSDLEVIEPMKLREQMKEVFQSGYTLYQ